MATTTGGSTYVTSTDLVADYPTASLALANHLDTVASGSIVYNTGNYTATVADSLGGKTIVQNSASANTVTLPSSGLVDGMMVRVANVGAGVVTISGGTILGTATVSQYNAVSAVYKASITSWWIISFSSGLSGLGGWATISATTGSPTTATWSDGTTTWQTWTFTGSGSFTCTAGVLDTLSVGGGSALSNTNAAGIGGEVNEGILKFPAATYTVTIGAGASGSGSYDGAGDTTIGSVARARGARRPYSTAASVQVTRTSSITGTSLNYGPPNDKTRPGGGCGANDYTTAGNGIVILRRPA